MDAINLEGEWPFSIANVKRVAATAQGETVTLTLYASVAGRPEHKPAF